MIASFDRHSICCILAAPTPREHGPVLRTWKSLGNHALDAFFRGWPICLRQSDEYRPPERSSVSWFPISVTSPPSIVMMRSHCRMAESRCAMIGTFRLWAMAARLF
jgi:hypothetical protein